MGRYLKQSVVLLSVLLLAGPAEAHVDYVTENSDSVPVLDFFVSVFSDPLNVLLIVSGGLTVAVSIIGYVWRRPARYDVAAFRETMLEYSDLVPWILRLSVGLPLVGAGFAGYFFSPEVPPFIPLFVAPSRLFQLAIGMLLLFGLAARLAAVLGLVVYLISVPFFPDLMLANEFVAGFLAIMLLGSGRPSADQVLQRISEVEATIYHRLPPIHRIGWWLDSNVDPYEDYATTIIRIGLGFNFVYLGLTQKLLDPGPALAVVEKYSLTAIIPVSPGMWVVGVGLTEVVFGMLLILGLLTRGVSAIALLMFVLTLFALPDDPVLAHVSLFGYSSPLLITGSGPLAVDSRIREWAGSLGGGVP